MQGERALLGKGIDLFNAGDFWAAHEAWEEAWTPDRHGPDRGFWKGLIQVAAGTLHYSRRNRRGALNKWRGGLAYLDPYRPTHHGVELEPLVAAVSWHLAELEAARWPELRLPPLVLPEA